MRVPRAQGDGPRQRPRQHAAGGSGAGTDIRDAPGTRTCGVFAMWASHPRTSRVPAMSARGLISDAGTKGTVPSAGPGSDIGDTRKSVSPVFTPNLPVMSAFGIVPEVAANCAIGSFGPGAPPPLVEKEVRGSCFLAVSSQTMPQEKSGAGVCVSPAPSHRYSRVKRCVAAVVLNFDVKRTVASGGPSPPTMCCLPAASMMQRLPSWMTRLRAGTNMMCQIFAYAGLRRSRSSLRLTSIAGVGRSPPTRKPRRCARAFARPALGFPSMPTRGLHFHPKSPDRSIASQLLDYADEIASLCAGNNTAEPMKTVERAASYFDRLSMRPYLELVER